MTTNAPHSSHPAAGDWREQAKKILVAGEQWPVLFAGFELGVTRGLMEGRGLPRSGTPSEKQQHILDRLSARLALVEQMRAGTL